MQRQTRAECDGVKKRYRYRSLRWIAGSAALLAVCTAGGYQPESVSLTVHPTREHRDVHGELYTPATQSLLRTHSWLEKVETLRLWTRDSGAATLELQVPDGGNFLRIQNLPMHYLVPRLHYPAARPPDAFDAFNLMLAEYSRNSLSVPQGTGGDEMAHFQTNLRDSVPWKLQADYDFVPNPNYKPLRVAVTNNCLAPGLWELSATDRSGEIYHSWFTFPEDGYYELVAKTNRLDREFAREALTWREEPVRLDLDRLRKVAEDIGDVAITVWDERVGFSSQGSRRKISRDFVLYESAGALHPPRFLSDLHQHPVALSSFAEPGIYSARVEDRSRFDFAFLAEPRSARVRLVHPLTNYRWPQRAPAKLGPEERYVEITIDLGGDEQLIFGNLPLALLVEQEDFILHGFGVGILSPTGLAERRQFLIENGPRPSYAYLTVTRDRGLMALNSHSRGIEQVFIRSHPTAEPPYWEITITSYERIADLVKYRVEIPAALRQAQRKSSREYIPPIYFTYRDDNIN